MNFTEDKIAGLHVFNAMRLEKSTFKQGLAKLEGSIPKLAKDSLAFEPVMLKSALFRPTTGKRQVFNEYTPIPSHAGTQVFYKGEELRQCDQRILLMLLKARSGSNVAEAISFNPRQFAHNVLAWADASSSVNKLKDSLLRLQEARVRVMYSDGAIGAYSFVSDARLSEGGKTWMVWLSPRLVSMFERHTTYLPMAQRLAIKDGLESWLYSFVKADACLTAFSAEHLREMAGMCNYEQKEFNRRLKLELSKLLGHGVIKDYQIEAGKRLKITK